MEVFGRVKRLRPQSKFVMLKAPVANMAGPCVVVVIGDTLTLSEIVTLSKFDPVVIAQVGDTVLKL